MLRILKKHRYPYLFILPFFILFVVFQLIPTIWTFVISLTEWNGIGTPKPVGLKNYQNMLKDYMFWDATGNTVVYWITGVIGIMLLALLISCLLNSKLLRARSFFKTATFLPNVCAAIAMGLIFRMLFDENVGLINEFWVMLGGSKIPWLTSTSMSKIPVIILNIWRNTPWFTMIVLSGLLSIPDEYYEAATVDGASSIQQFFTITLPSLGNILFFCALAGFAFAKYQFPGRNFLFYFVIATMLLPPEVGAVPLFVIMKNLGLINSLWSLIIPRIATAVGIFYMRQYIMDVPNEIIEAARIDGCADFKIFTHIVMPIIKPAMASWAALTLIARWNDFFWPLLYLRKTTKYTLMVSISLLPVSDGLSTPWPIILAGTTFVIIPIIVIYLILQTFQKSGIVSGAVKG